MSKRTELLAEFNIDSNGCIRNPGKFEGEKLYVPYFWEAYLNGMADSDDGTTLRFTVDNNERAEFPELKGRRVIRLYQRDDGFVCEC